MIRYFMSVLLLPLAIHAPAEMIAPKDHQGQDLVLADGDVIWGEHVNVRSFVIPTSTTVFVRPLMRETVGAEPQFGRLEVRADEIRIDGTLSGIGAGYTGGGGGAGGGNTTMEFPSGSGRYPGFQPQSARQIDCSTHDGMLKDFLGVPGSQGDGPFGGRGGTITSASVNFEGGYLSVHANGDNTVDALIVIGSGGGGGRGGVGGAFILCPDSIGGGAGGGGDGGAAVGLRASTITLSGSVCVDGALGANGGTPHPSVGGDSSPAQEGLGSLGPEGSQGSQGGPGGSGAGGGLLIVASELVLGPDSQLSSLGGGGQTSNGGTIKIFTPILTNNQASEDQIQAGRIYQPGTLPPTVGWFLK